jgi:hypothetical protein
MSLVCDFASLNWIKPDFNAGPNVIGLWGDTLNLVPTLCLVFLFMLSLFRVLPNMSRNLGIDTNIIYMLQDLLTLFPRSVEAFLHFYDSFILLNKLSSSAKASTLFSPLISIQLLLILLWIFWMSYFRGEKPRYMKHNLVLKYQINDYICHLLFGKLYRFLFKEGSATTHKLVIKENLKAHVLCHPVQIVNCN